jgi:hypothetical protein
MSEAHSASRHEDAMRFIESIQEPKLRMVFEYALTTVLIRRGMNPAINAASDFDLRYFLEAIKAMFEDEATVRTIIDGKGDTLRWW